MKIDGHRYTAEQIARWAGVSRATVYGWHQGRHCPPFETLVEVLRSMIPTHRWGYIEYLASKRQAYRDKAA